MARRSSARPGPRLVVFLVVAVACFAALAGRLVWLQATPPEEYTAFGQRQLMRRMELPAMRGAIFDRNGHELALSVRQSTVWANPRQVTDPAAQAAALAPVLGVDARALQDRISRDAAFVYLARTVPDEVASQIEALDLPGIHLLPEPKRFRPADELGASVLGRVGTDNDGLSGLELQYEKVLAGRPGSQVIERTPAGTPYDGIRHRRPAVRGDDLVLTIDRSLQYETERALSDMIVSSTAKGGIAVVMDSDSGEILAMANLLAGAEGGPPQPAPHNMAVTNVYEPGSVNKLITVAGALEEGLVQADERLSVPGTIKVADHVFKEHDPHPTVQWSITDIMAQSSNVGAIMIGQKLGRDRLDGYLRDFGFGEQSGLEFPGESRGLMLEPRKWSGTSIATISIGQGIAVTALQAVAAYNVVANGGEYVAPKLVKAVVDAQGRAQPTPASERRRVISPRTAAAVNDMLAEAVRTGTGINAAIDGYTVAGKTGTARKPLENARGYKAGAYVSSFAGFVPAEKPALSAIVMLDEPTPIFGGLVAAPVFAEVTRYGLRQFRIPPPPATVDSAVEALELPEGSPAPGSAGNNLPGGGSPARNP
ncbi:MAG TPA: penicillin-binding protein 2 [Acidimicrobiales bacterium]|nr:penicillin-binding protein 2 [Acidimicrobiales bacterium]